jgi:hypothetical protein
MRPQSHGEGGEQHREEGMHPDDDDQKEEEGYGTKGKEDEAQGTNTLKPLSGLQVALLLKHL